ncbi:MAG: PTS sugar transporter subunit IIC [Spirochaetales bacterium]|jgi:mannose/fructose/N-acetylgalactosamine-specific phosphotransferase system component IIC|nr:PTS sugar transporter subunit IIC [Spirochaetales bacterium]
MLVQALLVSLVLYTLNTLGVIVGVFHANRPIIIAPLVGLVLGDLQTGIILGATFEAAFLGVIAVGGAMPADPAVGAAFGTAIAILSNASPEEALAIAVPVAVFGLSISYLPVTTINPIFVAAAQKAAAEGDEKKMLRWTVVMGLVSYLFTATAVFLGVYFGVDAVNRLLELLPKVILTGMGAAGSMLPAVGFALLLNMLFSKKIVVFFFVGAVLALYLSLPSIAIAVIAVAIGIYTFFAMPRTESAGVVKTVKSDDEEFLNE